MVGSLGWGCDFVAEESGFEKHEGSRSFETDLAFQSVGSENAHPRQSQLEIFGASMFFP